MPKEEGRLFTDPVKDVPIGELLEELRSGFVSASQQFREMLARGEDVSDIENKLKNDGFVVSGTGRCILP